LNLTQELLAVSKIETDKELIVVSKTELTRHIF
jgi:hypothetical protein